MPDALGSSSPGPTYATAFSRDIVSSPLARPVYFSTEARLDIDRLHDWLFEKNPEAALRLILVLNEHFEGLTDFSERGRLISVGIRELIVPFGGSTYVIRYEVAPEGVSISRIWHGLEHR